MYKKVEIIISKSPIIFDAIQSNLPAGNFIGGESPKWISTLPDNFVELYKKIDLLIIDDNINLNILPSLLYSTKVIINLTNRQLRENEILLKLPLKLSHFLKIINDIRVQTHIFNNINDDWIYDEQLAILFNKELRIRFTEKENEIFKHLLLAPNNQLDKESLLKNIWQYHPDTDTNTIDTHLYRLKQKLPDNIMLAKDNYYQLLISNQNVT